MTFRLRTSIPAVVLWACVIPTAFAQSDAEALNAKLIKTYASLNTYSSTTRFEHREQQQAGGWVECMRGDFHVAFDRKNQRLVYAKPDIQVYIDGEKLRVKDDNHPGSYLELPASKPLTYDGLTDQVSYVGRPAAVELALLLSPDPLKAIHGAEVTSMRALAPDAENRPGLESTSALGKLTLRMDPVSGLATLAVIEVDIQAEGPGATRVLQFDIQPGKPDQPLAEDPFTFKAGVLQRVASMTDWTGQGGGAQVNPAGGQAPNGPADAKSLEGHAAPALVLKTLDGKTYKLADDKSDVVILDFWATWCGPCVAWLPYLEHVQAWAKRENKSASIYAVNQGETIDQILTFQNKHGLFLPVLLDSDSAVGKAYGVTGIPTTVIIAKGQVVHVDVGMDPGGIDLVIQRINDILKPSAPPPAN